MTENEAIKELNERIELIKKDYKKEVEEYKEVLETAVRALAEIQQYREIGTVERFQQLAEQFKPHVTDKTSCPERHCNKYDKYRKENEKYHAIGTVEECREARERQIKIPLISNGRNSVPQCGKCGEIIDLMQGELNFCPNCGQAIDWSE